MKSGIFFRHIFLLLLLVSCAFASIGKITALNGNISVVREAKTLKAIPGFAIEQKDTITSSKGSAAQLVFNDNTVISVGSSTIFKVEEYLFDAFSPKARFGVQEGSFKTITGKIGKIAPDKFKMETKTATIGIRGTVFVGNVAPNGDLTIACTKGAITVTPNVPSAVAIVVPQGKFTRTAGVLVESPKVFTPANLKGLLNDLAPFANNQQGANQEEKQVAKKGQDNPAPTEDDNKYAYDNFKHVEAKNAKTKQQEPVNPVVIEDVSKKQANDKVDKNIDDNVQNITSYGYWQNQADNSLGDIAVVASQTANYKGQVGGVVVKNNNWRSFDAIAVNSNNAINLSFDFGATNAVTGSVKFDTVGGKSWNYSIDSVANANTAQVNTSSFSVSSGALNGTGDGKAITGGLINGRFYGANGSVAYGSLAASTATNTAYGVFKATK